MTSFARHRRRIVTVIPCIISYSATFSSSFPFPALPHSGSSLRLCTIFSSTHTFRAYLPRFAGPPSSSLRTITPRIVILLHAKMMRKQSEEQSDGLLAFICVGGRNSRREVPCMRKEAGVQDRYSPVTFEICAVENASRHFNLRSPELAVWLRFPRKR
jgi:hypothetical protein